MTAIGIITVRDGGYHPNRRLAEAAAVKGHRLFRISPYHVLPELATGRLGLLGGNGDIPDVVIPRQGALVGLASLTVIRHFRAMGIPLVNGPEAIVLASNKFLTLQALAGAGIAVPATLFVTGRDNLEQAVAGLGGYPVVAKQINGRQGDGVYLLRSRGEAMNLTDSAAFDPARGLLVQEFIQGADRRDFRLLVMDGRVAGAMELFRTGGDFRSNYHLNGAAARVDCPESMETMAVSAARVLGLAVAGVDMIVDSRGTARILEVNYSPGFRGLEQVTGLDIAGQMIDLAVAMARPRGETDQPG